MKILMFTQYYPPDINAQSIRMQSLVKALTERGHKVTIITSKSNRDNTKRENNFKKSKKYLNLEIYRIGGIKHNNVFWRRPINYIIFMINSLFCAFHLKQKRYDLIIVTSPPITSAVTAFLYCYIKQMDFILEIRDLWPETLVNLNILKNKLSINFLIYIEKLLYKKAKIVIVVSEGFKKKIILKGINENKIKVYTNGLDRNFILKNVNIEKKNSLRKKYNLPEHINIISYIGNIGIPQNLEIIIKSAEKLGEDILFLIVGEGFEKKHLLKLKEKKNLGYKIVFLNALPRDKVIDIYQLSDILFLQLRDLVIFKETIPSKIFDYLGSGIPIIYGLNGIAADILKESGNGIKIKPDCDEDLVEAIKTIKDNYALYIGRAKRGRDFVVKYYLREKIMNDYVVTLENIFHQQSIKK